MSTTKTIRDFIELNEWQVQEIKTAIQEVDNGEFATDDAIADVFKKWGVNAPAASTAPANSLFPIPAT